MNQTTILKFFLIKDEDRIFYNPSTKEYNQEQEKTRSRFVVELIEKYKYREQDIRLDVEIPGSDVFDSIDLVVFKDYNPFLVADCLTKKISDVELLRKGEVLIEKAKAIGASYAVLVLKERKIIFSLRNTVRRISDFPKLSTLD